MKKHLLAIALFALCTTGLNAASPKKVAPVYPYPVDICPGGRSQ